MNKSSLLMVPHSLRLFTPPYSSLPAGVDFWRAQPIHDAPYSRRYGLAMSETDAARAVSDLRSLTPACAFPETPVSFWATFSGGPLVRFRTFMRGPHCSEAQAIRYLTEQDTISCSLDMQEPLADDCELIRCPPGSSPQT